MFSRCVPLVALALVCGALRCEAAPSLSFNGVKLGQKWDAVLKAHPKAKVFSIPFDNVPMPKAQRLKVEAKTKTRYCLKRKEKSR